MTENDLQLIESSARPAFFGDHGARLILELVAEIRSLKAENARLGRSSENELKQVKRGEG